MGRGRPTPTDRRLWSEPPRGQLAQLGSWQPRPMASGIQTRRRPDRRFQHRIADIIFRQMFQCELCQLHFYNQDGTNGLVCFNQFHCQFKKQNKNRESRNVALELFLTYKRNLIECKGNQWLQMDNMAKSVSELTLYVGKHSLFKYGLHYSRKCRFRCTSWQVQT